MTDEYVSIDDLIAWIIVDEEYPRDDNLKN